MVFNNRSTTAIFFLTRRFYVWPPFLSRPFATEFMLGIRYAGTPLHSCVYMHICMRSHTGTHMSTHLSPPHQGKTIHRLDWANKTQSLENLSHEELDKWVILMGKPLLSRYSGLSVWCEVPTCLFLYTTLWGMHWFSPCFTNKETEAQSS